MPARARAPAAYASAVSFSLAQLDLDGLLVRIKDVLGADTATILLLDDSGSVLVARAAVGIEEEVEQRVCIPVGEGFAGRVAAERTAVQLEDVDQADILNPLLREKGIKSLLGVPLLAAGRLIGVLHVGVFTPRAFEPAEVDLLQLVGHCAATAVEHAYLFEAERRARLRLEDLQAVTDGLDQVKLNFVAVASHELRMPAAAVYGALATLRERGDVLSPEVQRQLAETAWEQSDRLRRLIEQLLDLSRLDARSIQIEPREVSLQRVLEDVVKATNLLSSEVTLDVDPELAVVADPLVIDRVVTNLVANARNYGRPPIRIAASQADRELTIVVEDSGDGIPDDLAARLFGRFERGSDGDGSGLGLAIAKAYANAHGGDLVYSSAGAGARFELTLPF